MSELKSNNIPLIEVDGKLFDLVSACANRAIEIAAERSLSSNYYIGYEHLEDLITKEQYDKYFDDIADAVSSRQEVLDLETDTHELNMILGTDWCKAMYDEDEMKELGETAGTRDLIPYLSITDKARRYEITEELMNRARSGPYWNEMGSADLLDSHDITIMTNRYGQPILGGQLNPWEQAAVDKFIGPDRWHKPPVGFDPIIALYQDKPVVMYTMGLSLEDGDGDRFHGDLDFMNAVAQMSAMAFGNDDRIESNVISKPFFAVPAKNGNESAEIAFILPATIIEYDLERSITALNKVVSLPGFPLNDLTWAKEQFDTVKDYYKEQIPSIVRQFPKVRPEWIERSIPEMASQLCQEIYDCYGELDTDKDVIDPARLVSFLPDARLVTEECYKLAQPLTLTTYANPRDPNYDLHSDETPTVSFDIPYGALREILAQDALDGERPLRVEEFLNMYTWDYSESIRGAWEAMQRKPILADRLKNIEENKGQQVNTKNLSKDDRGKEI